VLVCDIGFSVMFYEFGLTQIRHLYFADRTGRNVPKLSFELFILHLYNFLVFSKILTINTLKILLSMSTSVN
jgi:hypothetical protein